jgi:hypothetical protein
MIDQLSPLSRLSTTCPSVSTANSALPPGHASTVMALNKARCPLGKPPSNRP